MTREWEKSPRGSNALFRFFPVSRILPRGHGDQKDYGRVITVGKGAAMKKSVVMMLFLALFAAMAMPVAGIGPVQTQACGTDKPPPPPG
jgi:hypothetical protein